MASFFRTLASALFSLEERKSDPPCLRGGAGYLVGFKEPTAEQLAALTIPEGCVAVPYYVLGSPEIAGFGFAKAPQVGKVK